MANFISIPFRKLVYLLHLLNTSYQLYDTPVRAVVDCLAVLICLIWFFVLKHMFVCTHLQRIFLNVFSIQLFRTTKQKIFKICWQESQQNNSRPSKKCYSFFSYSLSTVIGLYYSRSRSNLKQTMGQNLPELLELKWRQWIGCLKLNRGNFQTVAVGFFILFDFLHFSVSFRSKMD